MSFTMKNVSNQSCKSGVGNNSKQDNLIFKYRILKLNHLSQELCVNKIYRANNLFKIKKTTVTLR